MKYKSLIKKGLKVGNNFGREGGRIDYSYPFMITIGNDVIISTNTVILAHDASLKNVLGISRVEPVTIGDEVFIGTGCIILPGVTIGEKSIIGAGSVVTKNVPLNEVWAGNPARKITTVDEYKKKHYQQSTDRLKEYQELPQFNNELNYQRCNNFNKKYLKKEL